MVGALKALGVKLEERWEAGEMVVHGCGGRFPVEVRAERVEGWGGGRCQLVCTAAAAASP